MSGKKRSLFLLLVFTLLPIFADRRENYFGNQSLFIEEIERDDGEISISLSVPVNPDSLVAGNILIDGQVMPADVRLSFNRRGDKVVIYEPPQWQRKKICIEIRNLLSYNGAVMVELPAFHLFPDDEFEWDEADEVDWCHHYQ